MLGAHGAAIGLMPEGDIVPRLQDFATVGYLYRSIEAGLHHLADKLGERRLFVGPPRAQATAIHFSWPELVAVTDLASACRAIEEILEQGEGPRGERRAAHFGQFVQILGSRLAVENSQTRSQPPAAMPMPHGDPAAGTGARYLGLRKRRIIRRTCHQDLLDQLGCRARTAGRVTAWVCTAKLKPPEKQRR